MGAQVAASHGKAFPQALATMRQHLGLPDGRLSHINKLAASVFWAYPIYAGFALFARDKEERLETAIKTFGWLAAFMILPHTVGKLIEKQTVGKTFPMVGSGQNMAMLGELLSGCLFYTSLPTLNALVFRKQRAEKMGLLKPDPTQGGQPPAPEPIRVASPVQSSGWVSPSVPPAWLTQPQPISRLVIPPPAWANPPLASRGMPWASSPYLSVATL